MVSIIVPGTLDAKVGKWVSELPELRYLRLNLTDQSMSGVEGFFDSTVPKFGWPTPSSKRSSDSGAFTNLDSTEVKNVTSPNAPRDVRQVDRPGPPRLQKAREVT